MNPRVPDILSRVTEAARRTLDRPSGDPRRLDAIEQLFEEAQEATSLATDQPRRFVNDWTMMLLTMLSRLERLGPLGPADDLARAETVGRALLPYVQDDMFAAHRAAARPRTTDHDFNRAGQGRT